ncbi:LysR family transcriptional regulator [Gephyromycinifex aptenodytis]|uniref:LysR family transcriptional regulator n=1 Tax=Gephyromycinifex aptenodytis TaxID=2716227 RepID=UPI001446DBA5|nr:LysR family transcriptional regulator [Gephyromycinifex aptenodytis]
MFDPRRLQCLYAVHVHGSVIDAAFELGMTASAVSQQIGKLEREVGALLLERAGRGVVLTDAALVLVDAARQIDGVTERAQARLDALRDDLTGTLRVASFPSAIQALVAPVLGELRVSAPNLRVRVHEMFPDRGHDAVVAGHVDVAVVDAWTHMTPSFSAGLEVTVLLEDPVDLLLPVGHRLADQESISVSDLVDDIWVADDREGFFRAWLINRMGRVRGRPRIDFRVDEAPAQVALTSAGLCVGLMPRLGLVELPDTVRLVPIEGEAPSRRIFALSRESSSRRPAVAHIVEAMRTLLL